MQNSNMKQLKAVQKCKKNYSKVPSYFGGGVYATAKPL
jgi:hypothetical protein